MSDHKVKELLARLHGELEKTDKVDSETLELVRELDTDTDIDRLLESGAAAEEYDSVLARANSMETRFAVDHPVAERFLREIIDSLSKIGI